MTGRKMNPARRNWFLRNKFVIITGAVLLALYVFICMSVYTYHEIVVKQSESTIPTLNMPVLTVPDADETIRIGTKLDIEVADPRFEVKLSRVVDETIESIAQSAVRDVDRYIALVATAKYTGEPGDMRGNMFVQARLTDFNAYDCMRCMVREDGGWKEISWRERCTYEFEKGKTYDIVYFVGRADYPGDVVLNVFNTDSECTTIHVQRGGDVS